MTLRKVKKMFIQEHFGSIGAYRKARNEDYSYVYVLWLAFLDSLIKDGLITEKQFSIATF